MNEALGYRLNSGVPDSGEADGFSPGVTLITVSVLPAPTATMTLKIPSSGELIRDTHTASGSPVAAEATS